MFRLRIYALVCKTAYLMAKHYNKIFNKWCDTYSKYQKDAEKIYEEIN